MLKNKIRLNEDTVIDIPALIESGLVILANSGGGKSWAIRKIAEEAVNQVQVILLDPEGEFASLREKYDFILAGKNADVPVEVRSAGLLATRLLELNKSAVIDLYELHPSERQRYVKLFCEAMVNCSKELYHPVIVILDEAHEYVPEGKPSEATWAVESLASKGRKRGQRLVLASQRISKISKNVTAECNNKLIGRASQDIDMKRAGDELGFNKERMVQLRQLKPGEFFAFGPAISEEVIKVKIGDVKTKHAKVGYKNATKVPPPSHVIKKILGELADLPKEAEKELKTTAELKAQVGKLKRELVEVTKNKGTKCTEKHISNQELVNIIQKNVQTAEAKIEAQYLKEISKIFEKIKRAKDILPDGENTFVVVKPERAFSAMSDFPGKPITVNSKNIISIIKNAKEALEKNNKFVLPAPVVIPLDDNAPLGKGEIVVLKAIAQFEEGTTNEHVAVLTGYKKTSRRVYLQRLSQKGYINVSGENIIATEAGIEALGSDFEPLPVGDELREHLLRTLPEGEKKVLSVLINAYPDNCSFEAIEEATNYKKTSRRVYLQRLGARKLVEVFSGSAKASDKLYG